MSLEKSNISWSAKQIATMFANGKISFDLIVQRSFVWERSRKSKLIESMILGYPVPAIYAKKINNESGKRGDNTYYILDGQQRLTTVYQYLTDQFALTDLNPVVYTDNNLQMECETDISGLTFSELPEALQDILKDTMFSITFFESLSDEEERELFLRLNNGKPLSTKAKVVAYCKDLREILNIGEHKLFKDMLSEKAINNKSQVAIVMKIWCMLNQDIKDVTFESKTFNPMIENTEITDAQKVAINEVLDYLVDVHEAILEKRNKPVAKKLYTEVHLVSLIPFAVEAMSKGINTDLMADWLIDFFGVENNSYEKYDEACRQGSARPQNIQIRNDELEKSFNEFFKDVE